MESTSHKQLVGRELEYSKYDVSHGSYQLTQIIQQSGGQTINGGLIAAGGQETIFELPPKVYNFAKSVLRYNIVPVAAGGGNSNIIFDDTVAEIRQLQLYTRAGLFLVDIQDLNMYLNLRLRSETKIEEVIRSGSSYKRMNPAEVND